MRKLIAAINMTLDGYCDHTAMIADDEIHQHYNDLLANSGTLVYGRTTYQLMESYWPTLIEKPSGNKTQDEFARLIQDISKIVFSRTLKNTVWNNARLATGSFEEEMTALKQQDGKDILVGSPSLIAASLDLGLADEFQISVQPTIIGKGLLLLENIHDRINLKLVKTKTFGCGAITLYYDRIKN